MGAGVEEVARAAVAHRAERHLARAVEAVEAVEEEEVVVVVVVVVDSAAAEERPACFPFCRMRESAGMKSLSPERRTAQSYLCDGRQ